MNFFLWLILVLFLLGYGFRIFLRYGMPWLLNRFMKKQQEKFNQANANQYGNDHIRKEGEVKIKTKAPSKEQNKDNDFGEYIDYEDV